MKKEQEPDIRKTNPINRLNVKNLKGHLHSSLDLTVIYYRTLMRLMKNRLDIKSAIFFHNLLCC